MKKIIVTGSEGLIGAEICKYFERNNNKVYRLDLQLGHDLNDEEFVKSWFKKNPAKYLVNCFALNDAVQSDRKKGTLFDFSLESFSKYLDVNLVSLFSVCRQFVKNNNKSSIVNFSSTYGIVAPDQRIYGKSRQNSAVFYAATKSAILNLTRYLAAYWQGKGIRVNTLSPGGVEKNQELNFRKKYSEKTMLGRMAKKDEYVGPIIFLSSDASSYMTGSNLIVDGGWTAW